MIHLSRRWPALTLPLLLVSCSESYPERLLEPDDGSAAVAQQASHTAQIQTLLAALFPQPQKRRAMVLFAEVKTHVASGNQEAAASGALELIELALATDLQDPKGPETLEQATRRLMEQLYLFAIAGPELDPAIFETESAAIAVVEPEGDTVVTEDGKAGASFPAGAVDEPVLLVVYRIDLEPGELCIPTKRVQREGCYHYDTYPVVEQFNVPVTVGICLDESGLTEEQASQFRLYKYDEGEPHVTALENVAAGFVDCDPLAGSAVGGAFARARGTLVRLLLPKPAYATDTGRGGLTDSFSRIGWARSTVLLYGPSMESSGEGHTEQRLAQDLGHDVVVVDAPTWLGMSAAGPGGFGDYDAIVIGEANASLAAVESTMGTWSPVVSGHVVVNALHSVRHHCDPSPTCDASVQFTPAAGLSFQNAIQWVAGGSLQGRAWTGFYFGMGTRYAGSPATPPGPAVAALAEFGTFQTLGRGGSFFSFGGDTDAVTIIDPASPVMAGLTGADLSYWWLSFHQLISAYPADFTPVLSGLQKMNSGDPGTAYAGMVVRAVAGAAAHH